MLRKFRLLLCLPFIAALLACGGGGGGGDSAANAGSARLEITVNGLPSGSAANVVVTGPGGFSQTVTQTQALIGLAGGTYEIASANTLSGSTIYASDQSRRTVALAESGTQAVTITYAASGTLTLGLSSVASGLSGPVHLTAPSGDARLFIVERPGRIRIVQNGSLLPAPFLDLTGSVATDGERGLLSMAFHPQYAANGFFYALYANPSGDIVVERFSVSSSNSNAADPASGQIIITIPHPGSSLHYGGLLEFGPDGMLYISTGDGGTGGEPAQNLGSLLGKLLRLDINNASSGAYAVPAGNPFAGQAGARPEIWAYGLRNPWRYAFDRVAGLLYLPDVGEGTREEINVTSADQGGLNYGWNIMEGSLCYLDGSCSREGLTLPTLEYGHDAGCSIIGGRVYRGSAIPELQGRFFYSDFCSGWLRSFAYRNGQATEQTEWSVPSLDQINAFGQDASGELYALLGNGDVLRVVRQP